MIYDQLPVTVIQPEQKTYDALDFINERVIGRNMTEALLVEIKEFNKILQIQAEILGEKEYEYVYLDRYNPDNYTDHYYPVIGKVYDKRNF